ncbi:MAG: folylpolyglutamate synthase/dihydrofolate synthase family protein [Alphaproteobacteria bacterium]
MTGVSAPRGAGSSGALLARLEALHPKVIDLSLGRIQRLLASLGDPHLKLPPVIHVAGTNGKGSTIAFMKAALEAAGRSAHVYTSPHLVHFHERIAVKGVPIGEAELAVLLAECEIMNRGELITFFEITTAAAFLAFSRTKADYTLLEVGLGGRLDATNVVPKPLASVIAPIGIDHQEFLGSSLAEIAAEKAGILKAGIPCLSARQPPEAEAVIERQAARLGCRLLRAGEDFDAHEEHGRLIYQDTDGLLDLPLPRLKGRHQHANAALAIAALRAVGAPTNEPAIAKGLAEVRWPARLQRLTRGPLIALAPEGADIWLDGAHNVMGAEALAQAMSEIEERSQRPLTMILGMLRTKDAEGFLAAFRGLVRHLITVPVSASAAGLAPGALYDIASGLGFEARPAQSVDEAVRFAAETADMELRAREAPRILICGSLYLAGEVLRENS